MNRNRIKNEIQKQKDYHEEMLIACQNGKSYNYDICDECLNTLGHSRSDEDDE